VWTACCYSQKTKNAKLTKCSSHKLKKNGCEKKNDLPVNGFASEVVSRTASRSACQDDRSDVQKKERKLTDHISPVSVQWTAQ
jgi:hypothetical protein